MLERPGEITGATSARADDCSEPRSDAYKGSTHTGTHRQAADGSLVAAQLLADQAHRIHKPDWCRTLAGDARSSQYFL